MTLPANLTTGTVTGTLLDTATGAPLKGSVTFTPDAQLLLNRGGLTAHAAVAKAVTLGKDGSFTVDLIGTDNVDIQPEGWTWRVEFRTNVPIAGFSFPLSSGVSVNIAALVPTPGSRGEFMFDAISDSAVASAINGPGTQSESQVLAKIDSHLGGDATGVLDPDTPADRRLLTQSSADSTFASLTTRTKHAPAFRLYFPEAEGATGSNTGDDSAAVNAAIAAAHAAGGGDVQLKGTYRLTSSISLSGKKNITLNGENFARPFGAAITWAGPDSTSCIVCDTGEGITIRGINFYASSATFAAAFIDFRGVGGGSMHVAVENNFFSGAGNLHTHIEAGVGHTYEIRKNHFYRARVAINGQTSTPVVSSVQTCLVQQNFFSNQMSFALITNPGANWKIDNNSVEPLSGNVAGFVRFTGTYTAVNLTVSDNWCGDIPTTASSGAQIEIAGGPITITGNTLGGGATGSAGIRCVGALSGGASNAVNITGNRFTAGAGGAFIDWGAFAHTANVYEFGNMNVAGSSTQYVGTRPPNLVNDLDLKGRPFLYVTVPADGIVTADATAGDAWFYLGANSITSLTLANGDRNGRRITIWVQNGGGGTGTVAWPSSIAFKGAAPSVSGAFAVTAVTLMWGGAALNNKWYEVTRNG